MSVQVVRADEDDGAGRHRQPTDGGAARCLPLDGRGGRIQTERIIEHCACVREVLKIVGVRRPPLQERSTSS